MNKNASAKDMTVVLTMYQLALSGKQLKEKDCFQD
jgi:hypothetical protein